MKKSTSKALLLILIGVFCCNPMFSQISYLGKISQHEDGVYGLLGVMSICFSIDKKNIYVSGQYSLAVFNYDESTGSEAFVEAYRSEDDGHNGLNSPACVKVSPDDKFVYVSSDHNNSISLYKRDAHNGTLKLLKIFYDTDEGFDGLRGAHEMGISNSGEYIYVAAWNDAKISTFSRDTITGYISHIQSIWRWEEGGLSWPMSLKLSRDSRFVYVASGINERLSVFEIHPETGKLTCVQTITGSNMHYSFSALEISNDNNYLYIAGISSLGIYLRDKQSGKLSLQSLFNSGDVGISGMIGIYSISVSPDDKNIYAISDSDTSFVNFSRNLSNNEFQFIESKQFKRHPFSNYGRSSTSMVCDNNYVFGASYWDQGVHKAKRNQTDGKLTYEKLIYEGEGAIVEGLWNPTSVCADEQQEMVYVSSYGNGISIFQRNDTTGKLIFRNVANKENQHTGLLRYNNKIVLSKDGNYLYALCQAGEYSGIAIFEVNHSSHNLLLIDSIMSDIYGFTGINNPLDFAFSPEGDHLYVLSSFYPKGIVQYVYNPQTGSLELNNIYEIAIADGYLDKISIGNNGKYVFIWNTDSKDITMLGRNTTTGELTWLSKNSIYPTDGVSNYGTSCIALSQDNKSMYVSYDQYNKLVNCSIDSVNHKLDVIQVFDYESSGIDGLKRIQQIGVRNDGTFVYTSSYDNNSLGLFYRDQSDGMLTFLKDYTELENDFNGLDRINGMCIPKNDRNLYLISDAEEAVASYSIDLYLGPDRDICEYDSVLLDAGKGYSTYRWSTNETTRRIYAKEEGHYHVRTTDEFGFIYNDTVYIKVHQKPEINLGPDVHGCYGIPVILNTGFNGENFWNTGSTSQSIAVENTGTYSVVIIDSHHCKNMDSVNVIFHPLPKVDLGTDKTIAINQTLVISVDNVPNCEYLWYNGATGASVAISGSSITDYSLEAWLEVTTNFGCKNRDTVLVTVDTTIVYVEPVEIKVGPVPTTDFVNIESNYIITNIDCYNIVGKLLFSKQPNSKRNTINAKEVSRGHYYLRITLNNGLTKTFKIVKI